jgi:hypothetical protein
MPLQLNDRVKETSATTGTIPIVLTGAAVGYQTVASSITSSNTFPYVVELVGGSEWEIGIGIYSSSNNSIIRTQILNSSNSGNIVNFSAGAKNVFITIPASLAPVTSKSLGQFASTTSSELLSIISDETGSGKLVFSNNAILVAPDIGRANGTSLTLSGDLSVTGNVYLSGNVTTLSSNNLSINDPLIYLAQDNPANLQDIGVVGHFTSGSYQHTGLVRDATDGVWKLFSNVATEPSTTIDFTGAIYDAIQVGSISTSNAVFSAASGSVPFFVTSNTLVTNLNADLLDGQHGTYYTGLTGSAYNQANSAYTQANTAVTTGQIAFGVANTATVIAQSAFTQANVVYTQANTAVILGESAFAQANAAYNKANTGSSATGLAPTAIKTANGYIAVANDLVRCNTAGGAFSISFPASPTDGNIIGIIDVGGTFGTNKLTILPNGNSLESDISPYILDLNGAYASFIYNSATSNWKLLETPVTVFNAISSMSVSMGGTGTNTLSANSVILGNGSSAVQTVAPGTSGNILTSNNGTWISASSPIPSQAANTGKYLTTDGATAAWVDLPVSVIYTQANTGVTTAQAAFNAANTKFSANGGTITGSVTISTDLSVSGNVYISGNTITLSSNNLSINDPLIYLANYNPANLQDIGIVGHFTSGTYQHTGLVRKASDGIWRLFSNVAAEPTDTMDFTGANYDTLQVGSLISSNASFTSALSVASGGTGANTLTGILKGNGNSAVTAVTAPSGTIVGTTDTQTLTNKTITALGSYETKVAMAALDIDLSLGSYFTKTLTAGATTFTVSNIPATGSVGSFVLDLTNAGLATITWTLSVAAGGNTAVKWVGGTAPSNLTASGRDSFGFYTYDTGTTWTGYVIGKDLK